MARVLTVLFAGALTALVMTGLGAEQSHASRTPTAASTKKDSYAQARKNADAQYKLDRDACSSLAANAKDICIAEAKGKNDIARAEAAVAYENTPATRENLRVARARASYEIGIEKCDDLAGTPKNVCVQEAKAALVRAKADAMADRVAGNARKGGGASVQDAAREAADEKREADYKVALEKCATFAGPAKDACIGNAKLQYGKT